MFTHLLLPTDGSPLSEAAFFKGVAFAKECNARITGVCVMPAFHVLTFDTVMLEDTKEEFLAESKAQAGCRHRWKRPGSRSRRQTTRSNRPQSRRPHGNSK